MVFDVRFSACCWRFLQAAEGNLRASADINFFFIPGCVRGLATCLCRGHCRCFFVPSRHTLPSLSGAACHALRQGWRAWVFQEWASSGRHEISSLPSLTSSLFRSIQIDDVRSWVLSSAPAASVGLGATFSPATWDRVSGVGQSSLCPWGATLLGSGITSAGLAVVALPMLLVSLLARFLLASDGLFPLITLTRLRSLRSVAG